MPGQAPALAASCRHSPGADPGAAGPSARSEQSRLPAGPTEPGHSSSGEPQSPLPSALRAGRHNRAWFQPRRLFPFAPSPDRLVAFTPPSSAAAASAPPRSSLSTAAGPSSGGDAAPGRQLHAAEVNLPLPVTFPQHPQSSPQAPRG